MLDACHLKHPNSGVRIILRAALFMRWVRAGKYPTARTLCDAAEISMPTAYRFIASLRDDLGAPLMYSAADRGWCLIDPDWRLGGL